MKNKNKKTNIHLLHSVLDEVVGTSDCFMYIILYPIAHLRHYKAQLCTECVYLRRIGP